MRMVAPSGPGSKELSRPKARTLRQGRATGGSWRHDPRDLLLHLIPGRGVAHHELPQPDLQPGRRFLV